MLPVDVRRCWERCLGEAAQPLMLPSVWKGLLVLDHRILIHRVGWLG
jgi:hypothetical protein